MHFFFFSYFKFKYLDLQNDASRLPDEEKTQQVLQPDIQPATGPLAYSRWRSGKRGVSIFKSGPAKKCPPKKNAEKF